MKFERDERKFDFHDIGCEIKRKRETSGMTQDQLALIIDRDPRTIIYNENDGQHPSLNTFYQMVTMFDISVDQFFYPDMSADDACKKRINTLARSMSEKELRLVENIIRTSKTARNGGSVKNATPFLLRISGGAR
ncbi:MAG: helix-turn-helix transcriptional regulator [Eubacteriales bacterium]